MKRVTSLNAQELLHMARQAIENNRPYEAIGQLELSLQQRSDIEAFYLLATEYIKIGMYDRATTGLQCILKLQQDYWLAYYQLGILHVLQDQIEPARQIWKALIEQCPADDGLVLLAKGMTHLIDNDFVDAIRFLDESVARNAALPEFNRDTVELLARIKRYLSEQAVASRNGNDSSPKWQDVFYS